jgi:GTP:adenosylcobinamide-phosphate guanylyltransferase
MLKVWYLISMLHGVHATPMRVVEIGPIDTLEKCTRIAIAMIQNAPTFQTYCQQREVKVEFGID